MKAKYQVLKTTKNLIPCPDCEGSGLQWRRVGHNEMEPYTCRRCKGKKEVAYTITQPIELETALKELRYVPVGK